MVSIFTLKVDLAFLGPVFRSAGRHVRNYVVSETENGHVELGDKYLEEARLLMADKLVVVYADAMSKHNFDTSYSV